MVKCWYENPTHRPSFADLVIELELLLEELTSQVSSLLLHYYLFTINKIRTDLRNFLKRKIKSKFDSEISNQADTVLFEFSEILKSIKYK